MLADFQTFCTAGKHMKFATKAIQRYPPHLRHVATLPWENKNSNFLQMWKETQTYCIFKIASNFVIRPQILIFSVFEIANLCPYWLQIKISMSLFLRIYFCDQFVALEIGHSRRHCSVCQQWGQDLNLYLKGYTAKRLTDEFPEKSWTKHGVNKLFRKLRDTGTVDRRPGSGRPSSARTEENVETVNDLVLSRED